MAERKTKTRQSENPGQPATPHVPSGRPEVIVEFLFDRGLLYIAINNIGNRPALSISVKFDKKIFGLGGSKEISALALFSNIEFMGPRREIKTLIDSSGAYFKSKQPTKISALVSYQDPEKRRYETTIRHDLAIYRDLVFVNTVTDSNVSDGPN
jgi:hypothetical protein